MSGIQRTLIAGNADKIADNFAAQVTAGYRVAIIAAGGSISTTQLNAVKAFVKTGFKDRWWFCLIDCCLFLGTDMTSGLVKIIAAPGAGTSYVLNGGVTYGETTGVSTSTNFNKWLGSGVIPASQGLALGDISLVIGANSTAGVQGIWGCDEADTGDVACIGGAPGSSHGNRVNHSSWSRAYSVSFTAMSTRVMTAEDGIGTIDATNASTGLLNTEIEMFRLTKFGTRYYGASCNIGFFAVGKMMTMAQAKSITVAARKLHLAARAVTALPRYVYMGDSITHGQSLTTPETQAYPFQVATARSAQAMSTAIAGSEMITSNGSSLAGRFRYEGATSWPIAKFFCMLGSNDIIIEDVTTNGDAAVIALFRSYLVTMANVLKGQGAQVIILSIPWTTRANSTKVLAWVDGALGAASDAGVTGIDTCRPMIDTGDPGQFLSDTVHLNLSGHTFVSNLILAVI